MNPARNEDTKSFPTPVLQFQDQPRQCPYLEEQQAVMPLVYPMSQLDGAEFDAYLEAGRRRSSAFLYHTACPKCNACQPTRVPVDEFLWTTSMLRVLKRGDAKIRVAVGLPDVDEQRVQLFNKHRSQRKLSTSEDWESLDDYEQGFVQSCCDTVELSFWHGEQLIGVTIVDCGAISVSAVYTYFDTDYSKLSIGTYSVLKQIQWTQTSGRKYLYLGMYVADNAHLRYKARYSPQERLIDNQWVRFDEPNDWFKHQD